MGAEELKNFFVSPFSLRLLWAVARTLIEEGCADRGVEGMNSLLEEEHAVLKDLLGQKLKKSPLWN